MEIRSSSIEQLKSAFGFISKLQFKDEVAADASETDASMEESAIAIAAFLKADGNSEDTRKAILGRYKELNPYYKELQDNYGVNPIMARLARDMDILYQDETLIANNKFLQYYREIYKECLVFFYATNYTKAYASEPNYRRWCLLAINLMTYIRLMNKFLEDPYDLEVMSPEIIDSFLNSFGIPYFRNLPYRYKKNIASNLNRLVTRKGTDNVIIDILDIFGFSDIDVFTYYLAKYEYRTEREGLRSERVINPRFLSHNIREKSLSQAIRKGVHRTHAYDVVIESDPLWKASKEEVASAEFDYVQTKYFSIESGFELAKETTSTIYLLNLIREIRSKYNTRDFLELHVPKISSSKVKLEDLIILLQVLTCDFYGMDDAIPQENTLPLMYSYLGQETKASTDITRSLYEDVDSMLLSNLPKTSKFDLTTTLNTYKRNEQIRKKVEQEMRITTDWKRYSKLKAFALTKFVQSVPNTEFNRYTTYSEYLGSRDINLLYYIREIRRISDSKKRIERLKNDIVLISDTIKEYIGGEFELVLGSATISIISEYIREVINVFKAFTVQLRDLDIFIIVREDISHRLFDEFVPKAYYRLNEVLELSDYGKFTGKLPLREYNRHGDVYKSPYAYFKASTTKSYREYLLRKARWFKEDKKPLRDRSAFAYSYSVHEKKRYGERWLEHSIMRPLEIKKLAVEGIPKSALIVHSYARKNDKLQVKQNSYGVKETSLRLRETALSYHKVRSSDKMVFKDDFLGRKTLNPSSELTLSDSTLSKERFEGVREGKRVIDHFVIRRK